MKFTEIIKRLAEDGKDTTELEAILYSFNEADTENDSVFYQNQLYGILCGLAVLDYITPDEVFEVNDNLSYGLA